jgi:hypothetical protein
MAPFLFHTDREFNFIHSVLIGRGQKKGRRDLPSSNCFKLENELFQRRKEQFDKLFLTGIRWKPVNMRVS